MDFEDLTLEELLTLVKCYRCLKFHKPQPNTSFSYCKNCENDINQTLEGLYIQYRVKLPEVK